MHEELKEKIDQILIELSKDIDLAICVGPASECKERIDDAISKARLKIQELT